MAENNTVKSYPVSSNSTLFYRLFIPTFWIVFFGLFTLIVWFMDERLGPLAFLSFKLGLTAFFLLGVLGLYATFMRLKRVELGAERVYVSNYFKTASYTFEQIETWKKIPIGFSTLVRFTLKEKGFFGKKIWFLLSPKLLEAFLEENPALRPVFEEEE